MRPHRRLGGRQVTVRHGPEAEPGRVGRRQAAERLQGAGAAVEVAREDEEVSLPCGDALALATPAQGGLDGQFHGFGPGVQQRLLEAGEGAEFFQQGRQAVVAQEPGRQAEVQALLDHGGGDARVVMPLAHRPLGTDQVHVAVALEIPQVDPVRPGADQLERVGSAGAVAGFLVNQAAGECRISGHVKGPPTDHGCFQGGQRFKARVFVPTGQPPGRPEPRPARWMDRILEPIG